MLWAGAEVGANIAPCEIGSCCSLSPFSLRTVHPREPILPRAMEAAPPMQTPPETMPRRHLRTARRPATPQTRTIQKPPLRSAAWGTRAPCTRSARRVRAGERTETLHGAPRSALATPSAQGVSLLARTPAANLTTVYPSGMAFHFVFLVAQRTRIVPHSQMPNVARSFIKVPPARRARETKGAQLFVRGHRSSSNTRRHRRRPTPRGKHHTRPPSSGRQTLGRR